MDKKSNRIEYLDFLRIIASFAIVLLHISASDWAVEDVFGFNWNVYNIYDSLSRWAVPIFVMISGALFLDTNKEISIKRIYSKYVLRLGIVYLIWNTFYALLNKANIVNVKSFLRAVVNGHYHMWFLIMICGLYMVLPILRKVTASKRTTEYFLILAFLFTSLIPFLLRLPYLNRFRLMYDYLSINTVIGYSGYFIAGYYLSKEIISKKQRRFIYLIGFAGFVFTAGVTAYKAFRDGYPLDTYYDPLSIGVVCMSVAVFVAAKYKKTSSFMQNSKVAAVLSKCSFGIYLVHPFVMYELYTVFGINVRIANPVVSVILLSAVVWVISFGISFVLNKIPVINKYLV